MTSPSVLAPSDQAEHTTGPVQPSVPVTPTPVTANEDLEDDSTIKTVDELVRRRARSYPDSVIVSYPSSGIDYVAYTMRQLDVFAYRVATHYQQHIPTRKSSDEKPTTVAVLGDSNLEYLITMLALSKLGHTTLFLSTRISQEALENLLVVTDSKYLVIHPRYLDSAQATKQSLSYLNILEIAPQSTFDFPVEVHADTRMDQTLDPLIETENRVFIIHSSGSTGLPKPIYQTQKSAIANYVFSPRMKAFITLPLYHNHGICNMFRAIYCGKPIHLYNAHLPLTNDYLVKIMNEHRFEVFYGVPYALKLLSESDEGLAQLRELKLVMYGGSACPDDLGNMLVDNGVNLIGHYGSTEVGQLMTSFRPPGDKAWNYVRETPKLSPFLRWIPRGPNLFECSVLHGWPSKVATNMDDGSYATKDLFEPHPTIPKAWKYIARRDDTINLVNGEMFNPVATEGTIRSSKHIAEAVIFGAGRPAPGVLIVPAATLANKSDDEILNVVWPVVELACSDVEAYARIAKHMIKLLPWDCTYPRTDKGSIIRQAFYRTYEKEINEVYDSAETASGDTKKMSLNEMQVFLRALVVDVLAKRIEFDDDTDFFALGLDSLQTIRMRSEILRKVDVGGNKLRQTVVFDYPSIKKLSSHLFALGSGDEAAQDVSIENEMRSLIDKYRYISIPPSERRSTVAVTGATGSLGAHIVAQLAADTKVKTIFCLVRAASDTQAEKRVKASLIQRRVYHTLPLLHRRKIVALAADLSDPKLALSDATYQRVRQDLTAAIHCAWSVNFNMRLSSFEKDNVAGVTHLLSLCKAAGEANGAPAAFNFCSSVSTVSRATVSPVPESVPDLEWAQGMGYAQSKCVAEHLCVRAASDSGIPTRVLRIGQIVADTKNGIWNATEAIPLMLQAALTIGALPKLRETPSWLPVDTVARAVADISLSDAEGSVFTNVVNPRTFRWTEGLLPALKAAGLSFEEVTPKEWIARLRKSNPDPKANPPIKLVDFFASKYDKEDSDFALSKEYTTDTACRLSPTLATAPVLEQGMVDRFVAYFKANAWASCVKESGVAPSSNNSKTVIVVAGPCGSGKSTLAASLSTHLNVPTIEGDALHSKAAVDKMAASVALTDEDRSSWLERIGTRAVEAVTDLGYNSVVASCSALRKGYRDILRSIVSEGTKGTNVVFLDLQCAAETLTERVTSRNGHYMPPSMVEGQMAVYEGAAVGEVDVLPLDAGAKPEELFDEATWVLGQVGICAN